jgi:hypothetical protein
VDEVGREGGPLKLPVGRQIVSLFCKREDGWESEREEGTDKATMDSRSTREFWKGA